MEFSVNADSYVKKLVKHGVLAKETHERTIRFAPPIVITYEQLDDALKIIKEVLTK